MLCLEQFMVDLLDFFCSIWSNLISSSNMFLIMQNSIKNKFIQTKNDNKEKKKERNLSNELKKTKKT